MPTLDWLDLLEKNFDKSFADLDILMGEFEIEHVFFLFLFIVFRINFISSFQSEVVLECRRKLSIISGIFAQLIHKIQTINKQNSDLEVDKLSFLSCKFLF